MSNIIDGQAGCSCLNCGHSVIVSTLDEAKKLKESLQWSESGDPFCPECEATVTFEHYIDDAVTTSVIPPVRGEVDMQDIFKNRKIVYVDLGAISKVPPGNNAGLIKMLIGDAAEQQSLAIEDEKLRLETLSKEMGKPVKALCGHTIKDEFHGSVSTFNCLICGTSGVIEQLVND